MALPKQRENESDSDFAVRLEKRKEADREYHRKWREANREAVREKNRKYREANREAVRGHDRRYRENKILAQAKGKPLQSNFSRGQRPRMLTRLIHQEAKNFCLEWGFEVERSLDNDVLRQAARNIRDSAELNGEPNPWYGTDFLHESAIADRCWPGVFRRYLSK